MEVCTGLRRILQKVVGGGDVLLGAREPLLPDPLFVIAPDLKEIGPRSHGSPGPRSGPGDGAGRVRPAGGGEGHPNLWLQTTGRCCSRSLRFQDPFLAVPGIRGGSGAKEHCEKENRDEPNCAAQGNPQQKILNPKDVEFLAGLWRRGPIP